MIVKIVWAVPETIAIYIVVLVCRISVMVMVFAGRMVIVTTASVGFSGVGIGGYGNAKN